MDLRGCVLTFRSMTADLQTCNLNPNSGPDAAGMGRLACRGRRFKICSATVLSIFHLPPLPLCEASNRKQTVMSHCLSLASNGRLEAQIHVSVHIMI